MMEKAAVCVLLLAAVANLYPLADKGEGVDQVAAQRAVWLEMQRRLNLAWEYEVSRGNDPALSLRVQDYGKRVLVSRERTLTAQREAGL